MSWSAAFINAISARNVEMVFGVRRLALVTTTATSSFDGQWVAATRRAQGLGLVWPAELGRRITDGQGGAIGLRRWTVGAGRWTFQVIGEDAIRRHLAAVKLGSYVELLGGPRGSTPTDWEQLIWGQVLGRERTDRAELTVTVGDPLAAMRSRPDITSEEGRLLSWLAQDDETVAADCLVAATEVELVSTDHFEIDTGTSLGMVLIDPNDGNDPFYLSFSGKATSPKRLTGLSTAAQFGTTRVDATFANLATVKRLFYIRDHPLNALLKMLLSGSGASGAGAAYDTLADTWGFGFFERLVDVSGIESVRDNHVQLTSGTYRWNMLLDAPLSNGYSYLAGLFAGAGLIITPSQGQLTARAIRDPYGSGIATLADEVTDERIEPNSVRVVFEHPEAPGSQSVTIVEDHLDKSKTQPDFESTSLPRLPGATLDVTGGPRVSATITAHLQEILDRVGPWYEQGPILVSASWAGLAQAGRTRGDIILLTAKRIAALHDRDGVAFNRYPALILDRQIDWRGNRVRMDLALLPPSPT